MKPRAWFRNNTWFVAASGCSGSGPTPAAAYAAWLRQITFSRKLPNGTELS